MNVSKIADLIAEGQRISPSQALTMAEEAPLSLLAKLAVERRNSLSGEVVYYNRNFHIEPSNICRFNCRFCSYRRGKESPEAWDYSLDQVEQIALSYANKPITEVHIVGGVHPDHDLYFYAEMIARVKRALPQATVKAFTAIELHDMIMRARLPLHDGLQLLVEAGMEAIPGGGAEIFDPVIRQQICPDKGTAEEWLELHRQAHLLGIPTNATILYGHIETWQHRIDHLNRLRLLQDETHGFNAFVPLKYRAANNSMQQIGEVSATEDMRMLALSRLFLDNFAHIKAYWVMYDKPTTEMALLFGADDIDGTIDDSTKIYSMAGAEQQHPRLTIEEIESMARNTGLTAVERDSFYNPVER